MMSYENVYRLILDTIPKPEMTVDTDGSCKRVWTWTAEKHTPVDDNPTIVIELHREWIEKQGMAGVFGGLSKEELLQAASDMLHAVARQASVPPDYNPRRKHWQSPKFIPKRKR